MKYPRMWHGARNRQAADLAQPACPVYSFCRIYGRQPLSLADLLAALAEPTRLRIVNCLAAAPLFVSDLQAMLDLPQPTVSRHLKVLRRAELVRDTPIAQFVLYRLRRDPDPLRSACSAAVLEAANQDPALRAERQQRPGAEPPDHARRVPSPELGTA